MLSELNIRNIAVISRADIVFQSGFNVFTGETGAGKSILIGAIGAVLGFRTPKELIRTGEAKASVSALFTRISPAVCEKISALGVECGGELSLSREITADSTVCRVNGQAITAAMLRQIGSLLMNIHGQMDNQMLSSPDFHRQFVDSFGGLEGLRENYSVCFSAFCEAEKRLRSVETDARERERRLDLLRYQTGEIEECRFLSGEEEELCARRSVIRNAERLTELLSCCRLLLSGGDEGDGAVEMTEEAAQNLTRAGELMESLQPLAQRLETLSYDMQDAAEELRDRFEELEFDPRELDEIEERIDLIHRMEKKYGGTIDEILLYDDQACQEVERIESADLSADELRARRDAAREDAQNAAAALTAARLEASSRFADAVRKELADLDMPQVIFEVCICEAPLGESGADEVEFLLSVNPGETPKPLAKIASGGEMSRIMLAIKNVISGVDDLGTLIFDEVDTGVSGRAAQKVGAKLRSAAKDRQILCVTHLAQVAAYADFHLLIEKRVEAERTFTSVTPLSRDGRIHELARIMSGETVTAAALESAGQLLAFSQGEA